MSRADDFLEYLLAYESDTFSARAWGLTRAEAQEIMDRIIGTVPRGLDGLQVAAILEEVREDRDGVSRPSSTAKAHLTLVYIEELPGEIRMARRAGEYTLHHDLRGEVNLEATIDPLNTRRRLQALVGSRVVFDLDLDPAAAKVIGRALLGEGDGV